MYPWEALLLLAKFNSLRKGGRATRLPFVVGEGDSPSPKMSLVQGMKPLGSVERSP